MFKFQFSIFLLLLSSCRLNTKITGQFVFNNSFIAVKEFIGEIECSPENRWFSSRTSFDLYPDYSYDMKLVYSDGKEKQFIGEYCVYVGDDGQSGTGYFHLENEKIDLVFEKSFFLIFDLPSWLNPEFEDEIRTIHFQRWGS